MTSRLCPVTRVTCPDDTVIVHLCHLSSCPTGNPTHRNSPTQSRETIARCSSNTSISRALSASASRFHDANSVPLSAINNGRKLHTFRQFSAVQSTPDDVPFYDPMGELRRLTSSALSTFGNIISKLASRRRQIARIQLLSSAKERS